MANETIGDGRVRLQYVDIGGGMHAVQVVALSGRVSTTGEGIKPDLPEAYAYNGDGTLNYVELADGDRVWRETYTYTSGKLAGVSGWVLQ